MSVVAGEGPRFYNIPDEILSKYMSSEEEQGLIKNKVMASIKECARNTAMGLASGKVKLDDIGD